MQTRLLIVSAGVLLLAGCTQKSQGQADNPVVSAASSASTSATNTATASDSGSPASSASSSSPTPTTPSSRPATSRPAPPPSPAPTIERGGCPSSALTVRALRGSGAAGHQFAFLQFTNSSTTSCTLTGYPGVQLLVGGTPVGQPAERSGKPISTVTIAPGASATAQLVDDSSCNAPNSDSVQVYPPNRTQRFVVALSLRGCTLHVDPVAPS